MDVFDISIADTASSSTGCPENWLGNVQKLHVTAFDEKDQPVRVTAIPYHAWSNRGPGKMAVWVNRRMSH